MDAEIMTKSFIIKGNFIYCNEEREAVIWEDSYGVCVDGVSAGVYREIPEKYTGLEVRDYSGCLILPGLVDLHVHAPQYGFRGIGFDSELIEWLNTHTFPVESHYQDEEYARRAYTIFAEDLKKSATTRAVVFGTIHRRSTEILMELLEEAGVNAYVGKVNMDRNAPEYYVENSAEESVESTVRFIEESRRRFRRIRPILTPRFVPACTDELMGRLAQLKKVYDLPVQSHLSENQSEISWVKELCPEASCYGDAYARSGILDGPAPAVMAHCVWSEEKEIELLREKNVFVAHCPKSNLNLMSGIAPVRRYIERGIRVGLGTDVAGGETLCVFEEMARAIQVSKMHWRYINDTEKPLTVSEALFLATRGGGAFFGKVGSFEKGFEFDAIVIDDSNLRTQLDPDLKERLERLIYCFGQCRIEAKYVAGDKIL